MKFIYNYKVGCCVCYADQTCVVSGRNITLALVILWYAKAECMVTDCNYLIIVIVRVNSLQAVCRLHEGVTHKSTNVAGFFCYCFLIVQKPHFNKHTAVRLHLKHVITICKYILIFVIFYKLSVCWLIVLAQTKA